MKVSAALDEDKGLLSSNFSFRGSNSLFWHPQAFTGTRTHPHAEKHTPHTHTIINSEAVRHSGIPFNPTTQETGAGRSLWVQGHPDLHSSRSGEDFVVRSYLNKRKYFINMTSHIL